MNMILNFERSQAAPQRLPVPALAELGSAAPQISVQAPDGAERVLLEQFIATVFSQTYGAQILEFLPLLVGLKSRTCFAGGLGLRPAGQGPLFVEQYLDESIERFVPADGRDDIVELGNLASASPGQGAFLYLMTVAALRELDIPMLVFAANRAVRTSIRRAGMEPVPVAPALPARLGPKARAWGSYYRGDPWVMYGDIPANLDRATTRSSTRRLLAENSGTVASLALALEEAGINGCS